MLGVCTHMSFVNSGITGPEFTNLSHSVARSLRLLTHALALQYSNPVWNARAMNESEQADFASFLHLYCTHISLCLQWAHRGENKSAVFLSHWHVFQWTLYGTVWSRSILARSLSVVLCWCPGDLAFLFYQFSHFKQSVYKDVIDFIV